MHVQCPSPPTSTPSTHRHIFHPTSDPHNPTHSPTTIFNSEKGPWHAKHATQTLFIHSDGDTKVTFTFHLHMVVPAARHTLCAQAGSALESEWWVWVQGGTGATAAKTWHHSFSSSCYMKMSWQAQLSPSCFWYHVYLIQRIPPDLDSPLLAWCRFV